MIIAFIVNIMSAVKNTFSFLTNLFFNYLKFHFHENQSSKWSCKSRILFTIPPPYDNFNGKRHFDLLSHIARRKVVITQLSIICGKSALASGAPVHHAHDTTTPLISVPGKLMMIFGFCHYRDRGA